MKTSFLEYNLLSEQDIKSLWDNAIFVFDTNVLLNLYRYSDDTSNKFIQVILELKARIWLPFQVGLEFNKNRLTVIGDQKKHYVEFEKKLNDIIGEIENKNRNPFFSDALFIKISSIKSEIKLEVDTKIKSYNESLKNDLLLEHINSIFDGKVGNIFSEEELKKLYSEGEKRYKDKTPPGYCDLKKPDNEKYGDLIIWKQIISKSKNDSVDIIFVLDDKKEDWWLDHQGKTISPRPELLKEFRCETNRKCHFYKPFQFLEYSSEYLGSSIKPEVIEEVKNYSPEIVKNDNFIQINLTLKGSQQDLNLLINEMKNAGYNIYTEFSNIDDLHDINIILPNIPDLERRLNSKYLSNLTGYNIKLIGSTKK